MIRGNRVRHIVHGRGRGAKANGLVVLLRFAAATAEPGIPVTASRWSAGRETPETARSVALAGC